MRGAHGRQPRQPHEPRGRSHTLLEMVDVVRGEAAAPSGEKTTIRFIGMDYDSRMQPDTQAGSEPEKGAGVLRDVGLVEREFDGQDR